jgi:pyruvate dehydrogenase E1 component alpha subunit
VLFVCEDNGFAAFTRMSETTGGPGAAARAEAIGVAATCVDGNDVLAVHDAAIELVARCRRGEGPAFLYAPTYRLDGHTIADRTPYRPAEEVAAQRQRDPIVRLTQTLIGLGAEPAALDQLETQAQAEMHEAVAFAAASPWPDPGEALTDVQDQGAPQ